MSSLLIELNNLIDNEINFAFSVRRGAPINGPGPGVGGRGPILGYLMYRNGFRCLSWPWSGDRRSGGPTEKLLELLELLLHSLELGQPRSQPFHLTQ
ncbi:MAG: hypothetical protein AAFY57_18405 [Cyanobacteria bacterium J06642_2]